MFFVCLPIPSYLKQVKCFPLPAFYIYSGISVLLTSFGNWTHYRQEETTITMSALYLSQHMVQILPVSILKSWGKHSGQLICTYGTTCFLYWNFTCTIWITWEFGREGCFQIGHFFKYSFVVVLIYIIGNISFYPWCLRRRY